jgi:hypothetical protein
MLTDAGSSPRRAVFDARDHRPHEARLSDAAMMARGRADDAYERRSNLMADAWTWNRPNMLAPVVLGDARAAYIKRISSAWKKPTPLSHLRRDQGEDEDDDPDAETDPEAARQAYLERVWSAQNAISGGSPEAAAQVEATQRRMSMSQPNATAASVAAERRRFRPRDAAAIADKETAYVEYCRRIENEWRR